MSADRVVFAAEPEGGPIHAVAYDRGIPHAKLNAPTLCGMTTIWLQEQAPWAVWREKTPGVPANPWFSARQCGPCADRLKV